MCYALGTKQQHVGNPCCFVLFYQKNDILRLFNDMFSSVSVFSGHGPCQHALRAPHGGLRGLLHCSAHPSAHLRCLLEVYTGAEAVSVLIVPPLMCQNHNKA